ncbi:MULTISPECIES: 30S ribosomal protein S18 [Geobacteraceae]|jgi:small subunit ribosomal protein S18|uniref:Small ribosomal subunit protein bS18 n=3 Tax=Geobacteraceae TaxID=213422 RepID=RS18_CITBB|nr:MULTISPECIES: 30S ribosomal protein S18 [Geobacteraceae]B5EHW8.1 RecName: Full=Small ribosomal subunit protein bS18; AltName: Full=30S ribosomal protein S18 [Citrifermentans bemidjiense Bem]C6E504.1 RecName: Full=Small ribosomal subunit protein bS18; AltName: Full=30S ribosomal protein S18 [Geobacter sp. M21]ACH39767.1 ribosomal protein S18 [Citrifermentans bemidjiense Bem]BCG46715.1 16S ribosomal protein S18p [Citrifermentans bremense]
MADERAPQRSTSGPRKKRPFQRRKVCRFCADKQVTIDYKDPRTLRYFVSERGKIIPRRISGNCSKHQREITEAIKRARNIALLPIAGSHATA